MRCAITTVIFGFFLAFTTFAQEVITAKQARNYIHKQITITDTVYETKVISSKLRVIFLGSPNPNNKLIVFQHVKFDTFKKNSSLTGFKISIKGRVKLINGTPTVDLIGKILFIGSIDL